MGNDSASSALDWNGAYVYLLLYILPVGLVLLSGILGNFLIITVTVCTKALKTLTGALVVNLAVADFFVMITVLPFIILANLQGGWKQGHVLCYAVGFAETFFTTSSVLSMAAVSYDRYTAIVRPNEYEDLKTRFIKRASLSALAVWSLGFINATIPIIDGSGYSFYEVTGTCTANWSAISFKATCIIGTIRFLLPFAIFTFSYGKIYYMAKRAKRKINPCPEPRNRQSQRSTKSNSSEDTYLSNSTSRNQSTNMASSTTSGTLSSSRSAYIEDNIQSKGDSGIGQIEHFNKIHHELLVNDVGKTIQTGLVRTNTQPEIPYSMTSALSRVSHRPDACHGMTPWQRAVANKFTKRKVFRSMILLYGTFLFSWMPYVVWTFWVQFLKDPSSISSNIVFIIAISNSLLNVYLYGFVKSTYRKALKGCLRKNLSLKRFRKTIAMQVQRADVATISKSIHMYGKRQSEVRYQSRVEKEHEYTSHETNNYEYSNRVTVRTQSLPDAKKFSQNRHC